MISNPKPGQIVKAWYRKSLRYAMPLHDRVGVVVTPGKGRPRNHLCRFGTREYMVPAGNLIPPENP